MGIYSVYQEVPDDAKNDPLVRDPARTITVEGVAPVPFMLMEDADLGLIYRWIKEVAVGLELHEVDEWFLVDGVRIFDPHAARLTEGVVPDGLKGGG